MIQIKRFKRQTKYVGLWVMPYAEYEERVNQFCKTVKVINVNTVHVGGYLTHFVVYDDGKN